MDDPAFLKSTESMDSSAKSDFYYFIGMHYNMNKKYRKADYYLNKCIDLNNKYYITYLLSKKELQD